MNAKMRWGPGCLLALVTATAGACFDSASDDRNLSPADLAGKAYDAGDSTIAPLGRKKTPTAAKVAELYGRLALVNYQSGQQHWVKVKDLDPPGRVLAIGVGDSCSVDKGAIVKAPWGKRKRLYKGTVDDTHGTFAHIQFNDGDRGWARCENIQPTGGMATPKPDDKPSVKTTKKQDDDRGRVCAYRPSQGKYVKCQSFSGGKCRTGVTPCKPSSKCVYRPDKGKYVKCGTFSHGKCRSGSRACKPSGKCVFSPSKGKYVRCSTFTQGKCKSGSRACTPS